MPKMSLTRLRLRPHNARPTAALAVLGAFALVLAACSSNTDDSDGGESAEGWAPTRDIEWIVPYSPGGGYDVYSRGIAQVMVEQGFVPDGINVVIRNTTPTTAGISAMFSAAPDGTTLGILPMPAAIAQEIQYPDVSQWVTEEFTVIGSVDENAYVVYVAADSPYETIEDLIAAEGLRGITVERGSSSDLASLAAIEAFGLDATMIYGAEGSSEVVTAALRGDVDFFVYGASDVVGFIDSGDIRPLVFLGTEEQRSAELEWLQDVPSAADAGFPDLAGTVTELRLIVAPPGLPDEVAAYLREAVYDTMTSDAFAEWAATAERPIVPRDYESATEAMQAQVAAMELLIPELDLAD